MLIRTVYRAIHPETGDVYGIFDLMCSAKDYSHEAWKDELIVEEFKIPEFIIKALFN